MSESQSTTASEQMDAFFDRYLLPKVALTVILTAALVGTWVTTTLNGTGGVIVTLAKWAFFVALGILTGGLIWKHLFVRPADMGTGTADYCAEMYARFGRIAVGAAAVATIAGVFVLRYYLTVFEGTVLVAAYGALLTAWLLFVGATVGRGNTVADQFRSSAGLVAVGGALLVVTVTAGLEVGTRGFELADACIRGLHLLAFAVWLGGAVWNIFVAVPTGQQRPTVPVVQAAGAQLERFRWTVAVILPTILATGLYQAVDGLGTELGWYVSSTVGAAVLSKVGFISLLVAIFKLCPMWRACSPIEGVCELDGIGDERSRVSSPDCGAGDGGDEVVTDD